ncbi:hypothetical protein GWI33_021096 [Rhynchophorus ferrugineus]|uniref:Uncharacterized protein n=1 Tax=Rhynchophorus ferrugineus TaxID=354439 RepID=A0A834I1V7_RHYFE|nr:hypothetical protein GWI33_021096 [Rhynchophorus ferrugineus]
MVAYKYYPSTICTLNIAMFHYFNQPELFEEWVIKTKRELFPPDDPEKRKAFEESFRISREKHADFEEKLG